MLKLQIVYTYLVLYIVHCLLKLDLLRLHRMQGVGFLRHAHQPLIQMQLGSVVLKVGNGTAEDQPKLFTVDLGRAHRTVVDERHGLHMLSIRWATLRHELCKAIHADPVGDNQMGCLYTWSVSRVLSTQITD